MGGGQMSLLHRAGSTYACEGLLAKRLWPLATPPPAPPQTVLNKQGGSQKSFQPLRITASQNPLQSTAPHSVWPLLFVSTSRKGGGGSQTSIRPAGGKSQGNQETTVIYFEADNMEPATESVRMVSLGNVFTACRFGQIRAQLRMQVVPHKAP